MIDPKKIIIALDNQDAESSRKILNDLAGQSVWVKVGMELFYKEGKKIIYEAHDLDFKIFLDLKLHDIPHTVESALKILCEYPIDMINVHAAGGIEMMKAAHDIVKASPRSPYLIAVTQLTSTTEDQMRREQKISVSLIDSVTHYAEMALNSELDGVVCSPHEVHAIKKLCGDHFLTITPGIRPSGIDHQDQKRVTTPSEAIRLGSDFLVIGRPITQNPNPKLALEAILKEEAL